MYQTFAALVSEECNQHPSKFGIVTKIPTSDSHSHVSMVSYWGRPNRSQFNVRDSIICTQSFFFYFLYFKINCKKSAESSHVATFNDDIPLS